MAQIKKIISLISFTQSGAALCRRLCDYFNEVQQKAEGYTMERYSVKYDLLKVENGLTEWTKKAFENSKAIIFIGACGIAVRHIAPYLKSKQTDPAVVVLDEKGNFAISLISGHIGGANELTKEIAAVIGATPVITTATDINGLFSVDKWAKENECFIDGINIVKDISSALLDGKKIGIYSDFKICIKLPKNVVQDMNLDIGFSISVYKNKPFNETLLLVPKKVTLGLGCRKDIPFENVEKALFKILKENNISIKALKNIASIELKKDEKALNTLSQKYRLPFETYTAQQLSQLKGDFTASDFVKQTTGVENVCERAAVMGSENGRLILKKQAVDGVTIALAVSDWGVRFEE